MASSQDDRQRNNTLNDSLLEQQLLERIEQTRVYKANEMNNIQKQSFILNKPLSNREKNAAKTNFQQQQDIDGLVQKISQYEEEKKYAENLSWTQKEYWKYMLKNNTDLFSLVLMESTIMIGAYPLTTFKTRIQARHANEDVCFFYKNNVKKTPVYYGISQAMFSLAIGNVANNAAYRLALLELNENSITKTFGTGVRNTLAFCVGDIVSAPFRIPFEVKRMLIQMNSQSGTHDSYMRAIRKSMFPLMLRDITFRCFFNAFYNFGLYSEYYMRQLFVKKEDAKSIQTALDRQSVAVSYNRQSSSMIISTALAILLSNPIDVVLTRLATQQYHKYTGFFNAVKTIYKEEGFSKLFLSGYGFRFGFFLVNGSFMLNWFDPFKQMVAEAYE